MLEDILVPIALFGGSTLVLTKFFDARHKERMAMIDRGLSTPDLFPRPVRRRPSLGPLKWGLLLLFVGSGFLIGEIMIPFTYIDHEALPGICAVIGGGAGLIIYYLLTRNKFTPEERGS
jgi:hypothetical protein